MRRTAICLAGLCLLVTAGYTMRRPGLQVGRQPDGAFVVSTLRRIEPGAISFDYRPIDLALHPSADLVAVLNQQQVLLIGSGGVVPGSVAALPAGSSYRGCAWSPSGDRLYVSVADGLVHEFLLSGHTLMPGRALQVQASPASDKDNPRPGGLCITRDGTTLFVATADRQTVAQVDLIAGRFVREFRVQRIPFQVRLSSDEKSLIVSDWGGWIPGPASHIAASGNTTVTVDARGVGVNGAVTLIDRDAGTSRSVTVGRHPTDIVVRGGTAWVANAADDTVSILDVRSARVTGSFSVRAPGRTRFGAMPCALAIKGETLLVCCGGDNAVAEVDLKSRRVTGYRPAGYFPTAIALARDGKSAFVLNTKGNGSVRNTARGLKGNAHDFQGTVSQVDLAGDADEASRLVARDNGWTHSPVELNPPLAVYRGAIEHVLYVIKENRTYDEVLGDLPEGNGDPALCDLGRYCPNAHALARQFTLFDNGYVNGTNSADGHAWSTQAVANDYIEHFYADYRTYADDGDCAMSISAGGMLWDQALKKGRTFRDYGEFCDDELAKFTPQPKSWMDVWKDRLRRPHRIKIEVGTRVAGLRPYIHPRYVYWPLLQSDQERADLFIEEYTKFSRANRVPQLTVLSLPCDHTEGLNPNYPKPASMVADNDLALGRIVAAVSNSPQWRHTCIFVIEDDAQSGPDHVDGHRTVYMALSPYTRHRFVDSRSYNTASMLRSIELMLGLDPMTQFDAETPPLSTCFSNVPDLAPYHAVPATIRLDDMNPRPSALNGAERKWQQLSMSLDWSGLDRPDTHKLNAVLWHALNPAASFAFPTGRSAHE